MFLFSPQFRGKDAHFEEHIFSKWVGNQPPTMISMGKQHTPRYGTPAWAETTANKQREVHFFSVVDM